MKTAGRLSILALVAYAVCASAQFITDHNPPNAMDKAALRRIASRLVIGMKEEDALAILSTNGVRLSAIVQETNDWALICCYTNGTPYFEAGLWLQFRQKPSRSGLIRTDRGLVVMTNGILVAASLEGIPIARTNGPTGEGKP